MHRQAITDLSITVLACFALALGLSALAIYNYVMGVYGAAIVSSVGVIVAALLGVLVD